MNRQFFDDFSKALINRAEHDCAVSDPGMADAAAMVLVGDVYALLVCDTVARGDPTTPAAPASRDDELLPFIR